MLKEAMRTASPLHLTSKMPHIPYGPIVYCAEGIDKANDIYTLFIDGANCDYELEYNEQYGLNTISVNGLRNKISYELYSKYASEIEYTTIKLISYSCFANRGKAIWLVGSM